MRTKRSRVGLLVLVAFALGAIAMPAGAQAAKVSVTSPGGAVPNATGGPGLATADGLFTQTFQLKGKKVKKQQVLDVNLTMNSFGNTGDVNDDLVVVLFGPRGDSASVPTPFFGTSFTNLKFDDQSPLKFYCNPFTRVASYCNFIIGATSAAATDFGFFTGVMDAGAYGPFDARGFNPAFKGTNPTGNWRLLVWDATVNPAGAPQTALLGTSTLEVTTGKKFAKE